MGVPSPNFFFQVGKRQRTAEVRGKDAFVSLTPLDTQENFNEGRTHYISDIFYLFIFCFSFAFCWFGFKW